jgi:signal transduction histidine kinase
MKPDLHPLSALNEEFPERSRIDVKLDMPLEPPRLLEGIELSAFPIVQECLTNVHRHTAIPLRQSALFRRALVYELKSKI